MTVSRFDIARRLRGSGRAGNPSRVPRAGGAMPGIIGLLAAQQKSAEI